MYQEKVLFVQTFRQLYMQHSIYPQSCYKVVLVELLVIDTIMLPPPMLVSFQSHTFWPSQNQQSSSGLAMKLVNFVVLNHDELYDVNEGSRLQLKVHVRDAIHFIILILKKLAIVFGDNVANLYCCGRHSSFW